MTFDITQTGTLLALPDVTSPVFQQAFRITEPLIFVKEFYITSAQVLALNATLVTVLAAPGAGYATLFRGCGIYKPAGTAYAAVAAGEDLAFKYTNTSGLLVGSCETTGFLDQTTAQYRFVRSYHAASGVGDITPTANAPIVLEMLTGEVTTGTSPLMLRLQYSIVKTVLDHIGTAYTQT